MWKRLKEVEQFDPGPNLKTVSLREQFILSRQRAHMAVSTIRATNIEGLDQSNLRKLGRHLSEKGDLQKRHP
jgi:hypothetical protein